MPKNFVRKTFDHWLAQNRRHFTHQPRIVLKRKDFFILQFSGIAPEIKCFISKSGAFEIRVVYQKEYWDIIAEFDVAEARTPDGCYYYSEKLIFLRKFFPLTYRSGSSILLRQLSAL